MNKILEKLIDLIIEKYSVTRERSRDNMTTSIEDIGSFKKELKEVIELYYESTFDNTYIKPIIPDICELGITCDKNCKSVG